MYAFTPGFFALKHACKTCALTSVLPYVGFRDFNFLDAIREYENNILLTDD